MKPGFVLDCSVAAAWLFEDESSPYAEAVLNRLERESAAAPPLFHLEIANVLLTAERKKRISRAQSDRLIVSLAALPIVMDDAPSALEAGTIIGLARDCALTAYDATSLELAMRLSLPLATLDPRLRAAAKSVGVAAVQGSKREHQKPRPAFE